MSDERALERGATPGRRQPRPWSRDGLVLLASLVVHVALAAALVHTRPPSRAPVAPVTGSTAEVELELTPPLRTDRPSDTPLEAKPSEVPTRAARLAPTPSPSPPAPSEPLAQPTSPSEAVATAPGDVPAAAPSPSGSARPALGLADLGVGKNPFVPGRSGAPNDTPATSAPPAEGPSAKERVEASLRESARAREAELGLGPDGPVRAALADAMYASDAPVTGMVRFSVVADGRGRVLSVEAISGDRGLSAYRSMETLARKKLASAVLRLPSTAKGARLEVVVTSAWKLPSGHDPGAKVSLFGQDLTKGGGKAATQIAVLPLPKVVCVAADDPKNELKLPLCGLSAPLVATDGDPADIGAKPRRIVSTRVASSEVL
jgi:hypothetical protein